MKVSLNIKVEVEAKYVKIDAGVRYWEDSLINNVEDVDLLEDKNARPRMPFSVLIKDIPDDQIYKVYYRENQYRWQPIIDIELGKIIDWPIGTTARIHYKVCDDGIYTLFDKDMKQIYQVDNYVPNFLGRNGYGDYIIMNVDEHGKIENFTCSPIDLREVFVQLDD